MNELGNTTTFLSSCALSGDGKRLEDTVSNYLHVDSSNMLLCNSVEGAVDLCFRTFCASSTANVVVLEPTCELYGYWAAVNKVACRSVGLDSNFELSAEKLVESCDDDTKIIWLCSPNYPTGNLFSEESIRCVLDLFDGIVVVDERFASCSSSFSWRRFVGRYHNLVVLDSIGRKCGAEDLNVGVLYSCKENVAMGGRYALAYGVDMFQCRNIVHRLSLLADNGRRVAMFSAERQRLMKAIEMLPECKRVYRSAADFFVAEFADADIVEQRILEAGGVVEPMPGIATDAKLLKITVGSKTDNNRMLAALRCL